jgi:hypothetical protein
LWVSDFVDPVECGQSVGNGGSLYRCNDYVTLLIKDIILKACVAIAMTTPSRSVSPEGEALAEVA